MKQRLLSACSYLVVVSLLLIVLITCIDISCFQRGFYKEEFHSLDIAAQNHVSEEDLMKATDALLDYIQGKRDDVIVEIDWYELSTEAFNERERAHMVDVRGLYQFAMVLRGIALVLLLFASGFLIYALKRDCWKLFATAYVRCGICFVLVVGMLGFWAAVDFTSLWEMFHHIFFTNDLWLLNPHTDFMIRMFPEPLFFHLVLRITVPFLVIFVGLWGMGAWYLKKHHLLVQAIYGTHRI